MTLAYAEKKALERHLGRIAEYERGSLQMKISNKCICFLFVFVTGANFKKLVRRTSAVGDAVDPSTSMSVKVSLIALIICIFA